MGGLGETAALPPPCWRHQELLPRGAVSLLGRRQSHNTHGTSVTASSCGVEELYLAQPGGRGVAGARAGRTRDPALTCHDPRQMIGHDGHNQKPHTAEQLSRFLIIAAWCTGGCHLSSDPTRDHRNNVRCLLCCLLHSSRITGSGDMRPDTGRGALCGVG